MIKRFVRAYLLSGLFLVSFYATGYCLQFKTDSIPFTAHYDILKLKYTQIFDSQKLTGVIHNDKINEASGLVCGLKNRNTLYTINDSGNKNILWLIGTDGSDKGAFYIDGCSNRDWEDIAINDKDEMPYIYIADIGDNYLRYKEIYVYRVIEPNIPQNSQKVYHLQGAKTYVMTYPDEPHNAESFFIDPISKNWYIFTKGTECRIFMAAYPQSSEDTIRLKYSGILPFSFLTAGDITSDGMEVVLKNYKEIYYWRRKDKNETISQLLQEPPFRVPYIPEVHGESVGWSYDASGFFTTSEKREYNDTKVFFFKKKE